MSKSILIVDDSALVRKQLSDIITPLGFEIEFAKNGQAAVEKALEHQYDLITMDINMPVMDGIEAVKQIMDKKPTAILMVSSLTTENASITMDALDAGAIDYISKPGTMNVGKKENYDEIIEKVTTISKIPLRRIKRRLTKPVMRERRSASATPRAKSRPIVERSSRELQKIILIGSSTGGPGLIDRICASLPENFKHTLCIVQHMPAQFTEAFATRLERASILPVQETKQNMELLPGNIYLARGGVHLNFSKKVSGKIVIRENTEKGSSFFQPSVADMMESALDVFDCKNIISVILTGIGDDGADAMVKLRKAGAYTLGESENTATVYGMPKAAYDRGGVMEQLDFPLLLKKIVLLK